MKLTTSRSIGNICATRRGRRKVVPAAVARWNPCAGNSKAASNAVASSGPNRAAAASWLWKLPAATKIGMKSGSQIKNSVRMHPLKIGHPLPAVVVRAKPDGCSQQNRTLVVFKTGLIFCHACSLRPFLYALFAGSEDRALRGRNPSAAPSLTDGRLGGLAPPGRPCRCQGQCDKSNLPHDCHARFA